MVTAVAVAALAPQQAMADKHASKGTSAQADIEKRLQMMEDEMRALRSELAKSRAEAKADAKATAEKVSAQQAQVDEKLSEVKTAKGKKSLLFFRGGFAQNDVGRGDELLTDAAYISGDNSDNQGWYIGAGLDFNLTDNAWGLLNDVQVDGELLFEYKKFSELKKNCAVAGAAACTPLQVAINNQGAGLNTLGFGNDSVTVTQFTLSAAPKIKFNQLSSLGIRPWIMPVGLALHVISPPSDGVTVLNPGMVFGGGMEYNIWGDLWAGFDARYHLTAGDLDGTETDGFTAGGYVGFGF